MTEQAQESHEIITRDDGGRPVALATLPPGSIAQFLPKSVSELAVVAKFAAQAHLFGVPDQVTALNIMLAGAHLGLTPYAALEGISLVKGRPVVSAQVQWTLILARGQVEDYSIDGDEKRCSITVTSRKWREAKTQEVMLEDVPKHLFAKTSSGADPNWVKFPADMLFAYCVRKLRKRYFPEVMVGALDRGEMDGEIVDAPAVARVVDVGAIEERVPEAVQTPPCAHQVPSADPDVYVDCGAATELVPGRSGGMFLRCTAGHMMPPPQAVRDAIRGHRDGTAAIQREEVPDAGTVVDVAPAVADVAPGPGAGEVVQPEPEAPSGAGPVGVVVDREFMEAAGIEAPTERYDPESHPEAMTRGEVDVLVQAILSHLTVVRKVPERYAAARTILDAHGYDGSPLTTWLQTHPEELAGLRDDLATGEGALPL